MPRTQDPEFPIASQIPANAALDREPRGIDEEALALAIGAGMALGPPMTSGQTAQGSSDGRTIVRMLYIESPQATDEIPMGPVPDAATMVRVVAATDAGTVTFNIEKRAQTTPYTAGTNIFSSDQVAGTGGSVLNTTTFNSGQIAAASWLHFSASAIASSPTKLWVWAEYTID